jgi:hypothetical protein
MRCGVDLEAAFRQKRKEDIMIEKKIRELKQRREADAKPALRSVKSDDRREAMPEGEASNKKSGVLQWLKRS